MDNSLTLNGWSTTSLKGCVVTDFGKVQAARARHVESSYIYGANGAHEVLDGAYESYSRTFILQVKRLEDIQTFMNHLQTTDNELILGYQPDSLVYADVDEATYEPWGQHAWKLTLKLQMHPFRYMKTVPDVVLTAQGAVTNPGNVYSEPVIIVEGDGDVQLTIGSQTMYLSMKRKATIDCRHQKQNIYDAEGNLKNSFFNDGEFFELKPGPSGVVWKGTVTRVTIKGNWRYLV